jgi:hypothetical protein
VLQKIFSRDYTHDSHHARTDGEISAFTRLSLPNSDKTKELYREGAKILVFRAAASI